MLGIETNGGGQLNAQRKIKYMEVEKTKLMEEEN